MADVKISQLPSATLPVAGTEVLPIVQSSVTSKVSISNILSAPNPGNVSFSGTGNRITGDFSNATAANRVAFQTSTVNSSTVLTVIPNGTSDNPSLLLENSSSPANNGFAQLTVDTASASLRSGIRGTGTYVPMTFFTGGSERVRIDTSGNVGIGTNAPITSFGQSVHLYNGANTGTVASNSYLLVESATRNAVVELSGSASSTNGINFSDTPGTTVAGIASVVSDQNLLFRTGGTGERMRIDSSGNVGIGTSSPSASAILDAQSTTKGVRMPNMTTTQKNAIASPAAGLMVFDTTLSKLSVYSGAAWQTITSV